MIPLLAIKYCSEFNETEYLNPVVINNYKDAIEYEKADEHGNFPIEFLLFSDDTDVNTLIDDIDLHYYDHLDYYDLAEVQRHFGITEPTFDDGTEICIGDKFTINSNTFFWGYVFDNNEQYTGTVIGITNAHLVVVVFEGQTSRWEIPHYKLRKINE